MPLTVYALLALSLATALVAGIFLAFSDFVMRSLRATAPAGGTEAMQVINREVYRSLFMVLLMGLVPVTALIAAYAAFFLTGQIATLLILAGITYVLGVFGVTAGGNVPMNQRLATMPDGGTAAQAYWPSYVTGWLRWNHIRWVSASAASLGYAIAAVLTAASLA